MPEVRNPKTGRIANVTPERWAQDYKGWELVTAETNGQWKIVDGFLHNAFETLKKVGIQGLL